MRPKDAAGAVALLASHPIAGPRYGCGLNQLRSTWLDLLGRRAFWPVVFEEPGVGKVRMIRSRGPVSLSMMISFVS